MTSLRKTRSPQRIVSLAPSATAILCAIGGRRLLVGVTKWCKDVAPVAGVPALGDCWSLDSDRVLALKPTLVIGSVPLKTETVAKLLGAPFAFLALNPRSLADVESDIHMLGRIVGRSGAAESLIAKMRAGFASIARAARRALRGRTPPRVYCEAWPNPRISSPPWVAELVEIAGGRFCAPAGQRVSDDTVARARPEVIIIAWAATGARPKPAKTLAVRAFRDVPAVRARRVFVVRDEWLNTPAPTLLRGAQELLRLLHGGDDARRRRNRPRQKGSLK